jgi:hypothetical protein
VEDIPACSCFLVFFSSSHSLLFLFQMWDVWWARARWPLSAPSSPCPRALRGCPGHSLNGTDHEVVQTYALVCHRTQVETIPGHFPAPAPAPPPPAPAAPAPADPPPVPAAAPAAPPPPAPAAPALTDPPLPGPPGPPAPPLVPPLTVTSLSNACSCDMNPALGAAMPRRCFTKRRQSSVPPKRPVATR